MRAKRLLTLLLISLVLNVALLGVWLATPGSQVVFRREPPLPYTVVTNVLRPIRTNLVVRPRVLSWQDIESADYRTYIRNLRAIGCPEQTIRDIIIAEVDELFARRRATEVVTPKQQWWLSDADLAVLEKADEQKEALETERRQLLTQLLGPNWELSSSQLAEAPGSEITLDGPLLGGLSLETKRKLRQIEQQSRDRQRLSALEAKNDGRVVDAATLARLRQRTRDELAEVLTPAQLEEYLLRYSNSAQDWRRSLRGFDPTADEFRGLFRATDGIDQGLQLLGDAADPASVRRRQELQQQRDAAIQQTLSPERYTYYKLSQDPVFQDARQTAERLGAEVETVLPLYQINHETDLERQRILDDDTLTPEEQSLQLVLADQQRLSSLRKLLGEERFRRLQSADAR